MQKLGFIRPSGVGHLTTGWIHPILKFGFEIVASAPFNGAFDQDTLALVDNIDGRAFVVISVEDLIADRMGQYASGTAADRFEQAKALFLLHPDVDKEYLDRRIKEETVGDYGIEALEQG